ncbi:hypothetical protein CY34DRAFT_435040 [Suillus luteus UH-Slu-Lm8-n1]|uniref:Uncharacterized protein n=1 Tax=Suillus luteus UH-Slu-Lm8-n1 TaxID=930992 RepID=A0A0D0BU80_9AGAM|nr:hypothetical protein CY34DRAFT_435040 [Suillus luteus UH-Slu-Lm8-n1]
MAGVLYPSFAVQCTPQFYHSESVMRHWDQPYELQPSITFKTDLSLSFFFSYAAPCYTRPSSNLTRRRREGSASVV